MPGNAEYLPAIEIEPRDIGPFRQGNTGIDYVTTFDSGRPGPHVMVNALTHGNELSGAHAVGFLFDHAVRPSRGRLTLSFANVAAYLSFDPESPFESRFFDEDFNRVWDEATLDGPRDSVELARARAIRPIVDTVDMLLDLHSTALPMAPMMLCGMQDKGLALARGIGSPSYVVIDAGHAGAEAWAHDLRQRLPLEMTADGRQISRGVVFTNDPATARSFVGVLAVAEGPVDPFL